MKIKLSISILLNILLSPLSMQVHAAEKPDISEVVSIESDPYACGITDATMIYRDSTGELKRLEYRIWGDGCTGG